ncbi:MAG: PQQ-binding-like beta-propeller repeat protein [Verrucomicrobiota bacterium]
MKTPALGHHLCRRSLAALAWLLLPLVANAGNWPQWRGPLSNGSSDATGLPESCDPAKAKWVTAMPGAGYATPIVWDGRVFVTSTDPASKGLLALCVNAGDGKVLWQKRLGNEIKAPQNNGATPSAVTDGKFVCFLFGSGDLAALDMAGNPLWSRNLVKDYGNLCTKFGYSSSPLLWQGKLFVQILRRTKPYTGPAGSAEPLASLILAIDPLTGKTLWQHVRPTSAIDESCESYASPVPLDNPARKELLIQGGDCISGHDPATGDEYWRLDYNPQRETIWRLIPSPITVGELIVADKPRGGSLLALKAGGKGELQTAALAWTYDEHTSDSGTPLVYQGLIYVLQSDKNDSVARGSKSSAGIFLLVIDPLTGKEVGRCQIAKGGAWRSSPTGADGKIYVMSEDAEVVVVSAGPNGKILSRADFADGPACASISVASGCLFIRSASKLTCIAK